MIIGYTLLCLQLMMLAIFLSFGFYSILYTLYSLKKPNIAKGQYDNPKVAVVIVSFNEKAVLRDTIAACDKLTYQNKTIIVGDDSNDPETIDLLISIAVSKGAKKVENANYLDDNLEVYEAEGFVLYHRHRNVGFKAGNLKNLEKYLQGKGYDYMYLLDADWHPQEDTIERSLEAMTASDDIGYVQTKRLYYHGKYEHFQRCLSLNEESCYVVDLPGRENYGDMILFSGCCALFKLDSLIAVGGFKPGHLTEDIDLSNRFYLNGYKGLYLEDVASVGEVPPNYKTFMRQQERWAIGSSRTFKEYFLPIVKSKCMSVKIKLGLLRQNAYFMVPIAVEFAILLSLLVGSVFVFKDTFQGAYVVLDSFYAQYTPIVYSFTFIALVSNFLPLLATMYKRKKMINLVFLPLSVWISWSMLHVYFMANIKGLFKTQQTWIVTPKTNRKKTKVQVKSAWGLKVANLLTLGIITLVLYLTDENLALTIPFAILWLPALLLATIKS